MVYQIRNKIPYLLAISLNTLQLRHDFTFRNNCCDLTFKFLDAVKNQIVGLSCQITIPRFAINLKRTQMTIEVSFHVNIINVET